jgi:hypothetical protein
MIWASAALLLLASGFYAMVKKPSGVDISGVAAA